MDPNSIKVKAEGAAAVPGKPKFVPKAPVKKDSKPEVPAASEAAKDSSSSGANQSQGKHDKDRRNNRKDDRGGRGGGRGGGPGNSGRGQWVMPTGAAFFTGNASTALATKVNTLTIPTKSEPVGRIARPNEIIDEVLPVKVTGDKKSNLNKNATVVIDGDEVKDEVLPYVPMETAEESDSDASVHEGEADEDTGNMGVEGLEVWPPKRYDSNAPLSLPFGPKTGTMRKILAAQPILADPSDPVAIANEEQLSLFLVQLPSDLNFDQITNPEVAVTSTSQESANAVPEEQQPPKLAPNGKLGKLRLYKSGKVKLVTENGNEYDVNSGLTACFAQCLLSVDVPPQDDEDTILIKTEGGGVEASSSSSKKVPTKTKDNVLIGKEGKLCFLGNITKKLVVTPDYELGIRRKKQPNQSQSSTNLNQLHGNLELNIKEEVQEGTADDMMMEEDDGGDMYDD